ncbi:MAG TPA: thiamine phosphate synthase [Kofleriaceae bacterium]|nr:thiamine phosphate synthase [Kofleriaceae bacterium]
MARVFVLTDGRADPIARLTAIVRAVPAGAVAIQVREKHLDGGPLFALVRDVIALGAPVWVNDRVDVARAAGAHGVHLPESGLAIADARAIGGALQVGCSRHSSEAAVAAARDRADLVQLGPIWATPGKGEPIGPGALRVRLGGAQLVAVGGIDSPERARAAIAAGADAVAVIRAAWETDDPAGAVAALVRACDVSVRMTP